MRHFRSVLRDLDKGTKTSHQARKKKMLDKVFDHDQYRHRKLPPRKESPCCHEKTLGSWKLSLRHRKQMKEGARG
jgi:hypothetical protein